MTRVNEPPSLRSTIAAITLVVTLLALLSAGSLITLTSALHSATRSNALASESVRLAVQAEVDLLLHERAGDGVVRRGIEGDLRRKLDQARVFVNGEEEARIFGEVETTLSSYIESTRAPQNAPGEVAARQEAAFGALNQFAAINVAQAAASRRDAARWDKLADVLGIGVGALLILVAGAVLIWLRGRAFEPVLTLAAAMERFGRGERDVRAAEIGARELRMMSSRFNEMADAIAAQREAQMAFLGAVAHDLRNPLWALQASVTMLDPAKSLPSEERIRHTVARIERQLTRMQRMLTDFLDVAQIEAGRLELKIETVDAKRLVEGVVDLFQDLSSDHRIQLRLPDGSARLACDALRIEQVVSNLVSNAIKYSPRGSRIDVELQPSEEELVLSVIDQGSGISESERSRLFEPFQRGERSQKHIPGFGLGLYVVRRIVDAHGGRIELSSVPGAGSTFRVILPASSAERSAAASPSGALAHR